jgi:hypothetical protein
MSTVTAPELTDDILIDSLKYRTFGDLKLAPKASIIQTIGRMRSSHIRDLLDMWAYNTYYSNINMCGNLTSRIAHFNNNICYREIMRRCFDNIDIVTSAVTTPILNESTIEFISSLHSISPSLLGIFIDYLIRRIISELLGKEFNDNRARLYSTSIKGIVHECMPTLHHEYNTKTNKELRDICRTLGVFGSISSMNKETLIQKIEMASHTFGKCKLTCFENCTLPICQNLCYEKTKNTSLYKTQDIVGEIFLTSLFHTEAFCGSPTQDIIDSIYNTLVNTSNIIPLFINPLTELCKDIILDKTEILLNPALGGKLDDFDERIPSDADLVVDDILYDIKCTKSQYLDVKEITQLLGYSSLIMLNEKFRRKINTIGIINILQGKKTTYNIDFINRSNFLNYIKLLTHKT